MKGWFKDSAAEILEVGFGSSIRFSKSFAVAETPLKSGVS